MIPVTIPEQLRAIALLDATQRDAILSSVKEKARDPVMPPSHIPLWPGHRRYHSAIDKLDQLRPEARAALDELPDPWRIALLRQLQGRTQDQIAAELGISKMQLNSWQNSAKRVIQRKLWSGKTRISWDHTRPNAVRFTAAELERLPRLKQLQRTVLALWLDGRTVPEIAVKLSYDETSIRNLLEKARKRLKVLASPS